MNLQHIRSYLPKDRHHFPEDMNIRLSAAAHFCQWPYWCRCVIVSSFDQVTSNTSLTSGLWNDRLALHFIIIDKIRVHRSLLRLSMNDCCSWWSTVRLYGTTHTHNTQNCVEVIMRNGVACDKPMIWVIFCVIRSSNVGLFSFYNL